MNLTELLNAVNARKCEIDIGLAKLPDETALEAVELFDRWAADTEYPADKRLQHEGELYRVRQLHTSQAIYPPGSPGTEALYARVERPGQGDTPDDPIPYSGNMELIENKYYSEDGVTYRCFRGTGIPVYNRLVDLVGIYVEVVA